MKLPFINKIRTAPSILLCLGLTAATSTFATTYYVKPSGNNANDGLSTSSAWATINHAVGAVADDTGNTIIVLDGTYVLSQKILVSKSGHDESANLIIKAQNPRGATIDASNLVNFSQAVHITGSFVKIDGFKVKKAPGAGIFIDDTHHVTVTNCESFNHGKAGIYAQKSDFFWIDRNEVYGNCGAAGQITSGISIHFALTHTNDTNSTNPRIFVRWNKSYSNIQNSATINPTDGAGIILDDLRNAQTRVPDGAQLAVYEFPAVIEGNLTYNNGGPGIKVFSSKNVTVRNNTTYKNQTDWRTGGWRAEISIINSDNVKVVNNIATCDSTTNANRTPFGNFVQGNSLENEPTWTGDNENITWRNNLLWDYNPAVSIPSTNTTPGQSKPITTTSGAPEYNKVNSPGFVTVGSDFRITSASASRNSGTTSQGFNSKDLANNTRPQGTAIDIGCYEYVEP